MFLFVILITFHSLMILVVNTVRRYKQESKRFERYLNQQEVK